MKKICFLSAYVTIFLIFFNNGRITDYPIHTTKDMNQHSYFATDVLAFL